MLIILIVVGAITGAWLGDGSDEFRGAGLGAVIGTRTVTRCAWLPLLTASAAVAQDASDTLPELNNYAWGFPIETRGDATFYRVRLPLAANRSADDPRLRDSGVYNAAGQPVPRLIEQADDTVEDVETRTGLPVVPLFRNQEADPEQLRLIFEQDGDATRIDVRTDDASSRKMRPPLTAYVVDAREHDAPIDAVVLEWPEGDDGFIGHATVDGSDDLENWRILGSGALAELREGDTAIEQRRVDIAESRHDYLRIRWRDLPVDWRLSGIVAIRHDERASADREWLTLERVGRDEEDGGILFDLEARARVDRIDLALLEENSVVRADVFYRVEASMRWVRAGGDTFYRLRRGENGVSSTPLAIAPARAARFKVRLRQGHPDTPFELALGWRPDTLLFLAQGTGPYTFATGRPEAGADLFPEERALGDRSIRDLAGRNGPVATAALGERFPLGGVPHQPPAAAPDWRAIALWAALLVAVLFVGYMAMRIIRDLK